MTSYEVPTLARVYKNTIQRVRCDLGQLNSSAAFVLICSAQRKVILWIGSSCQSNDKTLAETLAFDVINEDFSHIGEIESMQEERERIDVLISILDLMWMKLEGRQIYMSSGCDALEVINSLSTDYRRTAKLRANPIQNSTATMSVVDKSSVTRDYCLKHLATSNATADGSVPKLSFIPQPDRKLVVLLVVGDQYDLW